MLLVVSFTFLFIAFVCMLATPVYVQEAYAHAKVSGTSIGSSSKEYTDKWIYDAFSIGPNTLIYICVGFFIIAVSLGLILTFVKIKNKNTYGFFAIPTLIPYFMPLVFLILGRILIGKRETGGFDYGIYHVYASVSYHTRFSGIFAFLLGIVAVSLQILVLSNRYKKLFGVSWFEPSEINKNDDSTDVLDVTGAKKQESKKTSGSEENDWPFF